MTDPAKAGERGKPILFSAPMVRALLAGTKTQTRRVLKPQPADDGKYHDLKACYRAKRIHLGDRLWVREAFSYETLDVDRCGFMPPWYWANGNPTSGEFTKPKPSIHMPRWASRLTLIVTDVRVQRLQDISEEDARAEGAYVAPRSGRVSDDYATMAVAGHWFASARGWYADLWDRINGAGSWGANPWVAAYSFEVHHQNIDALPLPAARDAAMKEGAT